MACGSVWYFLLFVYPALLARAVVHVSSMVWLDPLRRPATVTLASVFSTVQTSCPWDMSRATMLRAYMLGLPLMT
jgi:hypothetical protein